jgi:hypothetical protein
VVDVLATADSGADTVRFAGRASRREMKVTIDGPGRAARTFTSTITPGQAWRLITPFQVYTTGDGDHWSWDFVWLCAVFVPFGYWRAFTRETGPRLVGTAAPIALIAAVLAIVPIVFGMPLAPVYEFAGATLGVGVGWLAGRGIRARIQR